MDAYVSARVLLVAGRVAARETVTAPRVDRPSRQPSASFVLSTGRDAVTVRKPVRDVRIRQTSGMCAHGQVVWSSSTASSAAAQARPGRTRPYTYRGATVSGRESHRGEHEAAVNTIVQGMPA